jgi:hypothetical protein
VIFTLALRSLRSRPVRSAVLAGGFGLGVSVMAALLGIGAVILEQARAPALVGGGDVIIGGTAGRVPNASFVLTDVLATGSRAAHVKAASPSSRAALYFVDGQGVTPVRARGGIPSLERALGDPETRGIAAWTDTAADREWVTRDPGAMLRAIDRFHPIPALPPDAAQDGRSDQMPGRSSRASSWAEWLYFNGQHGSTRAGTVRFYLTFLAGPRLESGRRTLGVRLQLERGGRMTAYADSVRVDDRELLDSAPDLTAGANHVRVVGNEYRIAIDLPAESGSSRARGEIVLAATPGRSLPPFSIRGAGGWVSGYVVPVMAGALRGTVRAGADEIDLNGGTGYHDHNWGFWEGVSWQWGQVHGNGMSFVYGRVYPPADVADALRLPGFLVALGPDGLIGYATDVAIDETNRPGSTHPERIRVQGRSSSLSVKLDMTIDQTTVTHMRGGSFGSDLDFLQLRAEYRVTGQAGDKPIDFSASGSAETFRAR